MSISFINRITKLDPPQKGNWTETADKIIDQGTVDIEFQ